MMVSSIQKPKCKLPTLLTVSHLIGNTVVALREAGNDREMRDFINKVRKKDEEFDLTSVISMAKEYVDFQD